MTFANTSSAEPVILASSVWESGAEPARQAIVFIGALGSHRRMWDEAIRQLIALNPGESFTAIALDPRGLGDSPAPAGAYTMDELAADVVATVGEMGFESFDVVGLSIGGAIAQTLAHRYPEKIRRASFLCTAARFGTPESWKERFDAVSANGTASIAEAVVSRWFTPAFGATGPFAEYEKIVADASNAGYAGCCAALADFDSRPWLPELNLPVRVGAGADDGSTPVDVVQVIADLTHQELTVFPGAHLLPVEEPAAIAKFLSWHLRQES